MFYVRHIRSLNPTNDTSSTSTGDQIDIYQQFMKGKNRGPEFSKLETQYLNMVLGFHRLAINGLNVESNQPIVLKKNDREIVLICNGEIYNYKDLYKRMLVTPNTDSDCEVIIHLYVKYGIEQTLVMLDGVYSFILCDNDNIYIARDPFGVRPLYQLNSNHSNKNHNLYGFASELKCLEYFYNLNNKHYKLEQFKPGTYSNFRYNEELYYEPFITNKPYFIPSFSNTVLLSNDAVKMCEIYLSYLYNISTYLNMAVLKRCDTTERKVACLLSGGLDSSLIAALVANYFDTKGIQIETYSIGLQDSEDIKYAKIVAEYIGSTHTEIIVTEQEMFDAIPDVIKAIESYDTTTVRASIGNYLIGKYISKNSEAKVIFNGDGSDELFGGYLYMHKCPDDIEFDKETRRLLSDIYLFDVLRSDKSISSNGLEPRTPFLDRTFVNYVLSIPALTRNHNNHGEVEKYLLRESFSKSRFLNNKDLTILPDEILWRKKEAFSDGVSSHGRSLYKILQEKIAEKLNKELEELQSIAFNLALNKRYVPYEASIVTEKMYYKRIFDKEFPNCSHILPYFWMPKYTNATDPSARTLEIYKDT